MSRVNISFFLAVGLLVNAPSLFAATYVVGNCKPGLPTYPTISAAVSTVPPNSTVLVCPGTYAEQVNIAQPLTLQGISSANSDQIIIMPGQNLNSFPSIVSDGSGGFVSVAAQITVTAGPVNLVNLIADGAGATENFPTYLTGIFYASGSSGLINGVTVRNETGGPGVGIWAENGTSTNEALTIQNSNIHDFYNTGIVTFSNQTPATLTATVKGNTIDGTTLAPTGGVAFRSAGTLMNNLIKNIQNGTGISNLNASSTVSLNTITDTLDGIDIAYPGSTTKSNKVLNAKNTGIRFQSTAANNTTTQYNVITRSNIAIDLNCTTNPNVSNNTINEANVGTTNTPSIFASPNIYLSVGTIRVGGCGF